MIEGHILQLFDKEEQVTFVHPKNADTPIWRYMDFTKYVSMLENQGLFFAKPESLGDPFEGSYPRKSVEQRLKKLMATGLFKSEKDAGSQIEWAKTLRPYMLVNCWHLNDLESAAMWKLYTKSNESIALRSTYKWLRSVLPQYVEIGMVNYIDYDHEYIPVRNVFSPFIYKRKSFEHERELRALLWLLDPAAGYLPAIGPLPPPPVKGRWQTVDLNTLIESVYVSPTSPDWFLNLVEKVSSRHGLAKPLRSRLDEDPLF